MFEEPKWKDKYPISWCDLCETASIKCPSCKLGSCSGSGCQECHTDFTEFLKTKSSVEHYLTEEEIAVYKKTLHIKRFILKSLAKNHSAINWRELREDGQMSLDDEQLFAKELEEAECLNGLLPSTENIKNSIN